MLPIVLACELGHQLSDAFEEINHTIAQLDWYQFPAKLWQILPIIMASAQQPIRIEVFGSISCSRTDLRQVGFDWLFLVTFKRWMWNDTIFFRYWKRTIHFLWFFGKRDNSKVTTNHLNSTSMNRNYQTFFIKMDQIKSVHIFLQFPLFSCTKFFIAV